MKVTKAERIYQRHLEQMVKGKVNNAAIARGFHCSREYVRQVIEKAAKESQKVRG